MENKPRNGFLNKLLILLGNLLKRLSKLFDRIVFDGKGSIVVSLFISIFICVGVDYDSISFKLFNDTTSTVTISDVAVTTLYDEDEYKVSGIPSTVDVTLTGETTDIQVYRQQGSMNVVADLRKCEDGTNIIDLSVESLPSNISAKINPASVTAQIDKKETRDFTISLELLVGSGQKTSDFETPVSNTTSVKITGSQDDLDSIRMVKALIDTTGHAESFETDATLVAYDINGNVLDVDIMPETVKVTVEMAGN